MVSYAYLRDADLSKLSDAADEWSKLPAKYEGLLDQFEQQVMNRLKGHWEGEAATKGFAHMRKARDQYEAAATEARRTAKLLKDTHAEFKKHQKNLKDYVDKLADDHYKIDDQGRITDKHPIWDTPTGGKNIEWKEERKRLLKRHLDDLKDILEEATAADSAADMALRKDANGVDDRGFNKKGYASGDEAEAEKASGLAAKAARGEELSKTELNQLNDLLKFNRNDQQFSAKFATDLGPKGTMQFWAEVADPKVRPGERVSKDKEKLLKQMQANLGTALGTATRTDAPGMDKWKQGVIDLGPQGLNSSNAESSPRGFQVASNLMRYGKWDNEFLEDYGKKLIDTEMASSRDGMDPKMVWDFPAGSTPALNLGDPDDRGTDPMTGFMEALGNSSPDSSKMNADGEFADPSAAMSFFSDQENYDYLMEKRDWPTDGKPNSDDISGYNELGHALEAATTGHPYGEPPSKDLPPHTAMQAELMNRVIQDVSKSEDGVRDGMHDSLGRMASEYLPDFNRALSKDPDSADDLFPLEGEAALPTYDTEVSGQSQQAAARFLIKVGEDPSGFEAINLGQTAYSANLMDYHMKEPDESPLSPQRKMENIAESSGVVQGLLGVTRQESEIGDAVEADKEANERSQRGATYVSGAIGTGIGIGTSFIASPAVGAGVGGAATTVAGDLVNEVVKANEQNTSGDTSLRTGRDFASLELSTTNVTQEAYRAVSQAHGVTYVPDEDDELANKTTDGFERARELTRTHAREHESNLPS